MIWNDLRHGFRMMIKNPGFTLIAIMSIAMGVGANAAMFSFADGLVLRPLSVPRPREVLSVVSTTRTAQFTTGGRISYQDYVELRDRTRTFATLAAERLVLTGFDARADQPALRTLGAAVSGNLFDAMEIRPALGRFFLPDEDRVPGRDAVVVLDDRTWRMRFAADPLVLGRRVRIANADFTVIGVAPASFKGIAKDEWPAFYVPLAMIDQAQLPAPGDLTSRQVRLLRVKGRLSPGRTMAQADEEIAAIGLELARTYPDTNRAVGFDVQSELRLRVSDPSAMPAAMLMVLAVAVLLVACANVAGLLASRAPTRAREMALRSAIGAGRFRIIRQLITEALLIAAGGGALGMGIAYGGIRLFQRIEFPTEVPLKLGFELDRRVLVLGLAVAAASALFSSLIPAWQTSKVDLVSTIKSVVAAPRRSRQVGRHALVCLQVALSLVLLTVATSMYRSFREDLIAGPGFRTTGVFMVRFDDRLGGLTESRARQFYDRVTERTAGIAGVTGVSLTSSVPFKTDTTESVRLVPEGIRLPDNADDEQVRSSRVGQGFFTVMGIPLVEGRGLATADDERAPAVAVVNRSLAARYWRGSSALGKRLRIRVSPTDERWFEIVGVVADAKYDWIGEEAQPFVYLSRLQALPFQNTLLVATTGDAAALAAPIDGLVRQIDPGMPVFGARTMASLYQSRGIDIATGISGTVAAMGAMGLALALIGLYGLVSYSVSRRTQEIGVRMAVGATPGSVLTMVLRRGTVLTAIGIGFGLGGGWVSSRLLQANLPEIGGIQFGTYAAVVPVLVALTLFAAYVPARRASRIDPLRALRTE